MISSKSIPVPIVNQIDHRSFIYDFDMKVESNTRIQFSTWLNSSHLVGNQTIVFAILSASNSEIIQVSPIFIEPCVIQFVYEFI